MNSWIEIQKEAVVHNIKVFRSILSKSSQNHDVKLSLVLKSNAYGHGLKQMYSCISDLGIDQIAVSYLREASLLRDLGYTGSIFMLTPISIDDIEQAFSLDLQVELGGLGFLKAWIASSRRPKAHLKIDTGLSRQGFTLDNLSDVLDLILDSGVKSDVVGVFTHFANVEDVVQQTYAASQIDLFNKATSIISQKGFNLIRHASASSAILLLPQACFDMVRLGISLYGLWPSSLTRTSYEALYHELVDLKPVLSWKSFIASIKKIPKGQYVGYGCTYKTVKDTVVGVIPVGYYDGFFRSAGETKAYVLVNSQRAPLIGRVSMNLITVDLTNVAGVKENDTVTLIGQDGSETLEASTFADWAGTIHYEVISRLSSELKRIVV